MFLNSLIAKKKVLSQEKKKGFTLVELLVVIAIIAILATVSTVGYLGFTKQAKISNDLTELTQYKTLITGLTLDEKGASVEVKEKESEEASETTKNYTITYTFEANNKHSLKITDGTKEKGEDIIKALLGSDWIDGGHVIVNFDTAEGKTTNVTSIAYYHHYDADTTNGSVIWNIADDTVTKLA